MKKFSKGIVPTNR